MGEIFERTIPTEPLDWTGERLTTAVSGQIEIEHLHRYFFARELSRGCDVLDIACGEGYGSALLAQVAKSVVGVDVSADAVTHAQVTYQGSNIRFAEGDTRVIPMHDASVDRLVSFETLEHFYEHDAFMAEAARVLRPGGLLIISSPERDIYSPGESNANPYHVRELSRLEFEALLRTTFPHFRVLAQRPMIGSALLLDDGTPPTGTLTFEKRGPAHYEANSGLPRAPYLVAVASKSPIELALSSLFIETSEVGTILNHAREYPALVDHINADSSRASKLHEQLAVQQAEIERLMGLQSHFETVSAELEAVRRECDALRVAIRRSALASAGDADGWQHRYALLYNHLIRITRRVPRVFRKRIRKRLLGSAGEP